MDAIGDRHGLEKETGAVRLVAIIAASLYLFVLFGVAFFFGFDSTSERLFLLGIGQLVLAPVAAYAAFRLGILVVIALVAAALQLLCDTIQLLIRVFGLTLTVTEFFFILITLAFVVLDVLYLATLWRLRRRAANVVSEERLTDAEQHERRLRQAANTVRLAALFGLVASLFLFVPIAIFVGFSSTETQLTLYSIGHPFVALYAALLAPRNAYWMVGLLVLGFALLVLDVIELVLRLTVPSTVITALTLASILSVVLVLINIGFLLIDAVYILASFDYTYAAAEADFETVETPATETTIEPSKTAIDAYGLRHRKSSAKAQ